ncbi:MAG: hypothetical protein EBR09_07675 [Proteobacteria bacterium]|nr:hypothetical protein [Pseudomonadota bacterium]
MNFIKFGPYRKSQITVLWSLALGLAGGCRSSLAPAAKIPAAPLESVVHYVNEPIHSWEQNPTASTENRRNANRNGLRTGELPAIEIETKLNNETGEQDLSFKVTQNARVFYTLDGSIPAANGLRPQGSTRTFNATERISQPTIVRAIAVNAQGEISVLRSKIITPRRADFKLSKLPPRSKQVKSVYVTGSFRGWSTGFDESYRLTPQTDGSFQRTVLLDRTADVLYKFVVRYEDETFDWLADPTQPQSGLAPYNNNIIPAPRAQLSKFLIGKRDGIIDEAAVDLDMQSVAALDAGERIIRFKLKMFEGDAEKISVLFSNGKQISLEPQTGYTVDSLRYTVFSGLLSLPESSVQSTYVVVAKDADNTFFLGQKGLLTAEPFTGNQRNNAFDFVYDSETQQINGADLYQVPLWSIDTTWYQIFPERFRNGDKSNDVVGIFPTEWEKSLPALSRLERTVSPWTGSWFSFTPTERNMERIVRQTQPELDPREIQRQIIFTRRYGGDLKGVRDMLPYLKSVGITGVYFNPVFDSDSLHRYDTKDYRHVDAKLGPMTVGADGKPDLYEDDKQLLANERLDDPSTWKLTRADKEFMSVVSELQNNGIRVVIDGVFNHSASNGPLVEDIARRGRTSPYYEWFATSYEGEPNYYARSCQLSEFYPDSARYPFAAKIRFDSWAGFCPLINHRQGFADGALHPGLRKHIFAVVDRWFKPQNIDGIQFKGVDGIRLDVYADVPASFWRLFRKHLKGVKRDALIIAEDWYDGFDMLQGDQSDGIMNYRSRTLAESWFINPDLKNKFTASTAKNFLEGRLNGYREHTKHALWTMLDSHDTDRFLSKTIWQNRWLSTRPQDGNSWDNDTVNKPDRGALYSNDKPGLLEKEFFKGIVAFQMAYVGAPVIYYGAEVGMWGSDDPTCRKPMVWEDLSLGQQFETQCVTHPGTWCLENPNVKFSSDLDRDLLSVYSRIIKARNEHPALRRGKLNSSVKVSLNGQYLTIGNPEADFAWLWGFERSFGNKNFAYFLSNQLMTKDNQTVQIYTRFIPGKDAIELVSGRTYPVDEKGRISATIGRERSVLFVQNPD